MDAHGNSDYSNHDQESSDTTFKTVKLQRQQNGHSWSIVGFLIDENFRVLGVLDKPIPHSLMVEFAKKVAEGLCQLSISKIFCSKIMFSGSQLKL